MKIIKYKILSHQINKGTEEIPKYDDVLADKEIRCAEAYMESNLEAAKKEAYNGEYTIEDDGQLEEAQPTDAQRIAQLEEALDMLLNGVTE